MKAGQVVASAGIKVGVPRFLAVGGPDLLILDDKNVLWRWRPADTTGKGVLRRLPVQESASWGTDILGDRDLRRPTPTPRSTTCTSVDPSQQQILRYTPAGRRHQLPGRRDGLPGDAAGRRRR